MTSPKIQALGMTQAWFGTTWKAKGYVDGVGWRRPGGKASSKPWRCYRR